LQQLDQPRDPAAFAALPASMLAALPCGSVEEWTLVLAHTVACPLRHVRGARQRLAVLCQLCEVDV
jgi:hypothetical protein